MATTAHAEHVLGGWEVTVDDIPGFKKFYWWPTEEAVRKDLAEELKDPQIEVEVEFADWRLTDVPYESPKP